MAFKKPLGTTDFYPDEKAVQKKVFESLSNTARKFGFKEIETPAFETLELLTKKSGEETISQIFTLEAKGKEKFGLRFDLTVPITRMFVEKQKELPKPAKWFGLSRMWRYERPQAGRLREFYQISVEMFGSSKPEADAEIINLATQCLVDLGLTQDDFYVRLNNRKLLQGIVEDFTSEENAEKLIALVDKKNKIDEKEFMQGLKDLKVKEPSKFIKILESKNMEELEKCELNKNAKQGFEELKSVIELLEGDFVKLDLSTARGLAYYTGTVFELFDKSGKFRAIAGGGRYDNMVELFGGENCPATGFGLGYSTLSLLLAEKGLLPKPDTGVDYYIIILGDEQKKAGLKLISKLRKNSSVEYDFMGRAFKKQLDFANTVKAKNLIVLGENELKSGKAKVKDLATGKEKEIKIDL